MTDTNIKELVKEGLEKGIDYATYRETINFLLKNNRTSGDNQSESYINYTKLNVQRMKRLDKTLELSDELVQQIQGLKKRYQLLVITEAWCGDAAQSLPIIAKLSDLTDRIDLKIVFRDENMELMEQFQTNGANSIPKIIALQENCEVLGTWGPKPDRALSMLRAWQADDKGESKEEFSTRTQLWYSKDKGKSIMNEFTSLFHHWENKKVVVPCSETL